MQLALRQTEVTSHIKTTSTAAGGEGEDTEVAWWSKQVLTTSTTSATRAESCEDVAVDKNFLTAYSVNELLHI